MGMTADQAQSMEEAEAASSLQSLIDQAAEIVEPRQSGTERKAEIAAAFVTSDLHQFVEMQAILERLLDRMLANIIGPEDDGLLTPAELYDHMLEHLDRKETERLLEVRHKMVRTRLFAHITEENRRKGVADPEHTPGEAAVPKLRKRFVREGGKAKATLDHVKFAEKLSDEQVEAVFRTVDIPAQTRTVLDEDALMKLVGENPGVLDVIRDCIVPGGYSVARLCVREL